MSSTFKNITNGTLELLDENGARVYFGVGQTRSNMSNYLFRYTREGGSTQPSLRLEGPMVGEVPAANAYNHNMIGDPVGGKLLTINTADETAGQRRQVDSQFLGLRFIPAALEEDVVDAASFATEMGDGADMEGLYLNKSTGDLFIVAGGVVHNYTAATEEVVE